MEKNLIESTLEEENLFKGALLDVWRDRVLLPDEKESFREYIRHPGAVVIVARFGNGDILMEEQFRYAPKQVFWELPAGKIDPGENILNAAQRELLEETGFAAQTWEYVGFFYPAIGYSDEVIQIFQAYHLEKVSSPQLDEGEFLNVVRFSEAQLLEKIKNGEILDGKTLATLARVGIFKTLKQKNRNAAF